MATPAANIQASRALFQDRAGWFTLALLLVAAVGDGWSGRPVGIEHQLLLLPFTSAFLFGVWKLLSPKTPVGRDRFSMKFQNHTYLRFLLAFEAIALALFFYEGRHFAAFGYHLSLGSAAIVLFIVLSAIGLSRRNNPERVRYFSAGAYSLGVVLAIVSFPLNYLRSDMLPVILWADRNLLSRHISPYATMHVADRLYDFPYLPGMLVAYLPFVAAHIDLRFASILAMAAIAQLLFSAARPEAKLPVALLTGLLLLDPFLQYRHDLYLQPHWLTLVGGFLLMQRRRFLWGAFVLGLGMAIYQFSWLVLPFVVLNAFRRRGWLEAIKVAIAAVAGALLLAGPFLRSAFARISSNTVGQWGRFEHAIADPMNLSYWITYAVRPDKLLRLQAGLMVAIFTWCVVRRRCATLEDTLRWVVVALTVFILCNSLVDGYFFLMLLVPMLLFTLVANDWLSEGRDIDPNAKEWARAEREPTSP